MNIVNTNVPALVAQNVLRKTSQDMDKAMESLSTGKRINSGADDPGGLMVATRLKSSSITNRQAAQNANEATSMLQYFSENGRTIIDILMEMKQIAIRAATDSYNPADRVGLDEAFNMLGKEWARIAAGGQWNGGAAGMNTYTNSFAVRLDGGTTPITMTFKSWDPTNNTANQNVTEATVAISDDNNLRTDRAWGFDQVLNDLQSPPIANQKSNSHIQSITAANNAVAKLDATIASATMELAQFGTYIKRLEFAANNATSGAIETDRAYSKIVDADYAQATTELTRTQIITQAATAMLAQANQLSQIILKLLQ